MNSGAWFAVFAYNFWKSNPNLPLQKKNRIDNNRSVEMGVS
jgi:hypothetical protein